MRKLTLMLLPALAALAGAQGASGAVRYAAPGGTGGFPCAAADPCSLDVAVALPGDAGLTEVALAAGDYVRTTPLRLLNPRILRGPGPGAGRARISVVLPAIENAVVVGGAGSVLRDLTIAAENAIYAVSIDRHATLERVRVVSGGTPSGGVLARPGTVLRDTAIVAEDGLAVAAVLDSVLAGTPIDLVNVTALSGAYAGLRVMISAVDGHVRMDNTIARTRDGAHDVDVLAPTGGADVRFSASHSSFDRLLCAPGATCALGAGNQDQAPLLDAGLLQQPGSPTIDAGTPTPIGGLGAHDVDGAPRAAGARVDIGAAEHPAPPVPPPPGGGGGDGAGAAEPSPGPTGPPSSDPPPEPTGPVDPTDRPPAEPDVTAPRISELSLSATRFTRRRPATLRVRVDEAATVRVALRRARTGRRAHGRCVATSHRPPARRRCARWVRAGAALQRQTGATRRVTVRLRRGLRPGRYRARVVARDAAGNRSTARRIAFVVARGRGR